MTGTLRLVLGDQLSRSLSSLGDLAEGDIVLMAEVMAEATYVPHHKKKLAFVFSAMRHFAETLRNDGVEVRYVALDDPANAGSLQGEVGRALKALGCDRVIVTEPGEWRLAEEMAGWERALGVPVEIRSDDRFLCSRDEFGRWAEGRRQLRMESFYREMRKRYRILLDDDDAPIGGKWNFDQENRKPPRDGLNTSRPTHFTPDPTTRAALDLVGERFAGNFGDLEPFWFAVTAGDAKRAFQHFIKRGLPRFGDYQDAMLADDDWLFHAVISQYLNIGLLDPLVCCREAEAAYHAGAAPLNAVEGFIRQILGWREYVRGIYWLKMPAYANSNALGADRPLPDFYWTGATEMNCLAKVIGQTRREAHSHHIQRLMVTGNFALLAGLRPEDVNLWYMVVYADAYEWVELPNVHGMALFADGGLLGSKPYAAGGNYINKMSDFCGACRYDVRQKSGPDACPFNYLYWNFLIENETKLRGNPRLGPVYRTLDRMGEGRIEEIRRDAERFLGTLQPWERAA